MAIALDDITKIIEDGKKMKHEVSVRDIAYVLLLRSFKEKNIAYASLFGKDFTSEVLDRYDKSPKIRYLRKYMKSNYAESNVAGQKESKVNYEDITFEENKEQLIKNLAKIKEMNENGELDAKDFIKLDIEIRTKLNDKFAVSEKQDEQRIIVETKFNTICPHTHRECWVQTKEYAIQHWDLIENPNKSKDNINDKEDEQQD